VYEARIRLVTFSTINKGSLQTISCIKMKTIHLIRHAKSSWEDSGLSDINRPLAQRGINDCKIMGEHLIGAGWNHQNIYCSQAQRAQLTIAGIAEACAQLDWVSLPQMNIEWQVAPKLYTFSADVLIDWLSEYSDEFDEVTLVGHNPALTDLINQLSDTNLSNLPTCSYAQLTAEIHQWQETEATKFHMVHFLKPKMFK